MSAGIVTDLSEDYIVSFIRAKQS